MNMFWEEFFMHSRVFELVDLAAPRCLSGAGSLQKPRLSVSSPLHQINSSSYNASSCNIIKALSFLADYVKVSGLLDIIYFQKLKKRSIVKNMLFIKFSLAPGPSGGSTV